MKEDHYEKLKHVVEKHNIKKRHERILSKHPAVIKMLEKVPKKSNSKFTQQWMIEELIEILDTLKGGFEELSIDPYDFIELTNLVETEMLTRIKAKTILKKFIPKSFPVQKYLERK